VQRIADSYRSAIGSAAISILTAYFESQDELKDSDENRQEFAKYALDNLRFLYRRGDGDDKTVSVRIVLLFFGTDTRYRNFGDFIKVHSWCKLLPLTSAQLKVHAKFLA
jgi:hypothetical protein